MVCLYGIRWEKENMDLPEEVRFSDSLIAFPPEPEPISSCGREELISLAEDRWGEKIVSASGIYYEAMDGKRFKDIDEYRKYCGKEYFT